MEANTRASFLHYPPPTTAPKNMTLHKWTLSGAVGKP